MSVNDIVIVAALGLLLLAAFIAFGVGHARWSLVSVVAAFLIAAGVPAYLYIASRLLTHEHRWAQALRRSEQKLARVRDALEPARVGDGRGRFVKADEMLSIRELKQEADRWERALARVDTWRGRHWREASFTPPPADDQLGTLILPPPPPVRAMVRRGEAAARAEPPAGADEEPGEDGEAGDAGAAGDAQAAAAGVAIDPGTVVYLFDDTPFRANEEGGHYLGAFLVDTVTAEDGSGRLQITVRQLAPRDAYDARVLSRAYDSVSVYTELPSDRWLAFSETPPTGARPTADDGDGPADQDRRIAPQPRKRLDEVLDALVRNAPEDQDPDDPNDLLRFRDKVRRHALSPADVREAIDRAEWDDIRKKLEGGEILPGEYWAEVTFQDRIDLETFLGVGPDDIGPEAGLTIETDLAEAFALGDDKVVIDRVFYRRPLIDGQTLLHGSVLPVQSRRADEPLVSDGLAALRLILEREKTALEMAGGRLATSLEKSRAELDLLQSQAEQAAADLASWERDAAAATGLADRFEAAATEAAGRLRRTEQAIVELGRTLSAEIGRAVLEVDRSAPPAGAGTGPAAF